MSDWPIASLGSVVKFISGGTPSKDDARFWGGDIPWVSSAEMTERWISDTRLRLTEDGARAGTKRVPKNTVLVVVRGMSLAKEFRVSISKRDVTFNQDVKAALPSRAIDPVFLFFYLLSQNNAIRDSASEAAHGTKKLDMPVLEQWPIPVPPLATQQKIAAILSAHDDLIANNQRRITLLERMAEDIYREWFVRLRFPGDEQVKIEKGVPQGWSLAPSSDAFDVLGGGTPHTDTSSYWNGSIPFFTPKDASENFYAFTTEKSISEKGLQACSSQLFPKNTIFITARGTVGTLALAGCEMAMNQSCYALQPKHASAVYFHYLAIRESIAYLKGISKSGVFDNIVMDTFRNVPLLMPQPNLRDRFNQLVEPFFVQVASLLETNRQLATTRDALLPRLISGKLPVAALDIRFPLNSSPASQEMLSNP